MSYLRIRKNNFETLTKKTTNFFFFFLREGIERGIKEIDKKFLEKLDLIPICFLKLKSDWSKVIGQESKCTWRKVQLVERNQERIEWTQDFKSKTYFSSSHFDRSNSKGTKILKNSGKKFLQNHLETVFVIWHVCSWLQMIFITKIFKEKFNLYQISSNFSFLTPLNCIKHIKKLNFGRPQNLTHNHIYKI